MVERKSEEWRTVPLEKEPDRDANRPIKRKETLAGQYEEIDFSQKAEKVRRDESDANTDGGITLKLSRTEATL